MIETYGVDLSDVDKEGDIQDLLNVKKELSESSGKEVAWNKRIEEYLAQLVSLRDLVDSFLSTRDNLHSVLAHLDVPETIDLAEVDLHFTGLLANDRATLQESASADVDGLLRVQKHLSLAIQQLKLYLDSYVNAKRQTLLFTKFCDGYIDLKRAIYLMERVDRKYLTKLVRDADKIGRESVELGRVLKNAKTKDEEIVHMVEKMVGGVEEAAKMFKLLKARGAVGGIPKQVDQYKEYMEKKTADEE